MKKITVLMLALLVGMSGTAFGQAEQILHLSGHAWEDGGFPTSSPGEMLSVLFILNDIDEPLVWDTANYSYTGHIRELESLGEALFGLVEAQLEFDVAADGPVTGLTLHQAGRSVPAKKLP